MIALLRKRDLPTGHDFEAYLQQWREYRKHEPDHPLDSHEPTYVDWTVRGSVLYASEFWLRFMDEKWHNRRFPSRVPFKKLTWLQFLSLIGWTHLYQERIAGFIDIELHGTPFAIAHTSKRYADESGELNAESTEEFLDRWSTHGSERYPGLYFPMINAWNWWRVPPVRLPSSIRYLDTFAHQGGAADRLVVERKLEQMTDTTAVYRPVTPPNGYGINKLTLRKEALPNSAKKSVLNITLLFEQQTGLDSV